MKLEFQIFLILLGTIGVCLSNNSHMLCKREIVESYGLISYDEAKKERLVLCPNIQISCCPAYEQIKMFDMIQEQKPRFILVFEVIELLLLKMLQVLPSIFSQNIISPMIQGISDKPTKARLQYSWNKIKSKRPKLALTKALKSLKESHGFLAALQSSFPCMLCDLSSHSMIDLKKKTIVHSNAFCDVLVQNTLMFSHLMNEVLVNMLLELLGLISRLKKGTKTQKISGFKKLSKSIQECVEDFKSSDSGLTNCKNYCEYFSILKDNNAYKGYPEFLTNAIVVLEKIAPSNSTKSDSKSSSSSTKNQRILEDSLKKMTARQQKSNAQLFEKGLKKENLPEELLTSVRVLKEQSTENKLQTDVDEVPKLSPKRILKDSKSKNKTGKSSDEDFAKYDFFDPMSKKKTEVDIVDYRNNRNLSRQNQMIEIYQLFFKNSGDPETQKLKMFEDSVIVEMDERRRVIFPSQKRRKFNLATFETKIKPTGINPYESIKDLDLRLTKKQVMDSLSVSDGNDVEIILPETIVIANTIQNEDVKNLHQHQMLSFRQIDTRLYSETINHLVDELALHKLRHIIAEKMNYYNHFVRKMGQSQAQNFTENVENLMSIAEQMSLGQDTVSVNLIRTTDRNQRVRLGLVIISGQNATGFVNVTRVKNIHEEIEAKESLTKVMHIDDIMQEMKKEKEDFKIENPKKKKGRDSDTLRQLRLLNQKEINAREVIMRKLSLTSQDEGFTNQLTEKEVFGKLFKT